MTGNAQMKQTSWPLLKYEWRFNAGKLWDSNDSLALGDTITQVIRKGPLLGVNFSSLPVIFHLGSSRALKAVEGLWLIKFEQTNWTTQSVGPKPNYVALQWPWRPLPRLVECWPHHKPDYDQGRSSNSVVHLSFPRTSLATSHKCFLSVP